MLVELDFYPMPADTSHLDTDAKYLVTDKDGNYYTAEWDGEEFQVVSATEDGESDEGAEVDIVMIAVLPEFE